MFFLLSLLLFTACQTKKSVFFAFEDGFDEHQVEIEINKVPVIYNTRITTDESLGLTSLTFSLKKIGRNKYFVGFLQKKYYRFNEEIDWNGKDTLEVSVIISGTTYKFYPDLDKGCYLSFNNREKVGLQLDQSFEAIEYD